MGLKSKANPASIDNTKFKSLGEMLGPAPEDFDPENPISFNTVSDHIATLEEEVIRLRKRVAESEEIMKMFTGYEEDEFSPAMEPMAQPPLLASPTRTRISTLAE